MVIVSPVVGAPVVAAPVGPLLLLVTTIVLLLVTTFVLLTVRTAGGQVVLMFHTANHSALILKG